MRETFSLPTRSAMASVAPFFSRRITAERLATGRRKYARLSPHAANRIPETAPTCEKSFVCWRGQLGRNSRRNANSDERRYSALPEYLHSSFLQWLNDSQKLSWHRIRNIVEYQDWATVQMMFCAR